MLKTFFASFLSIAVIDFVWLGVIASSWYKKLLGDFARPIAEYRSTHWASGVFVYVLLTLALMIFVAPRAGSSVLMTALYGALFGLVVYGIYDFTNYAVVKNWPGAFIALDVAWGMVVCALGALIVRFWSNLFS